MAQIPKPIFTKCIIEDLYSKFKLRIEDIAYYCRCRPGTIHALLHKSNLIPNWVRRKPLSRLNFSIEKAKYSWIAAIIDTDGCIGIYKQYNYEYKWNPKKGKRVSLRKNQYTWIPKIAISNTSLPFLLSIFDLFGGTISKTRKQKNNSKACYQLTFCSPNIKKTLHKALPFLVLKRKQAKLILKLWGRNKKSKYITEESKRMITQIQELNYRGVR